MRIKVLSLVWAILLVVAVCLYIAGEHYHVFSMPPDTATNASNTGATAPTTPPTILGTLSNVSTSSITVTGKDGSVHMFALNRATEVYSQVASGQRGATPNKLSAGTLVSVAPDPNDPQTALSISINPVVQAATDSIQFGGVLVSDTPTSITLDTKTVELTPQTQIVYNVMSLEVAPQLKDLLPGSVLQITGKANADGTVTADTVLVVEPLSQ